MPAAWGVDGRPPRVGDRQDIRPRRPYAAYDSWSSRSRSSRPATWRAAWPCVRSRSRKLPADPPGPRHAAARPPRPGLRDRAGRRATAPSKARAGRCSITWPPMARTCGCVRIRTPSFVNMQRQAHAERREPGRRAADQASIAPCYSCTDRCFQKKGRQRRSVSRALTAWQVLPRPPGRARLRDGRSRGCPSTIRPRRHEGQASEASKVVVCWREHRARPRQRRFSSTSARAFPAADYTFSTGLNGDLAYNALQRIDDVVACDPDAVCAGRHNDVTASRTRVVRKNAIRYKKPAGRAHTAWYVENMSQIGRPASA